MSDELVKAIRDPKRQAEDPQSVTTAIRMVGELRMNQAVPTLVDNIGFPWIPHPENRDRPSPLVEGGVFNKDVKELLPAVPALIDIGAPCVDAVIGKLLTTESDMEINAALTVLRELSVRSAIRTKLQQARKKAGVEKAKRIDEALAEIAEE